MKKLSNKVIKSGDKKDKEVKTWEQTNLSNNPTEASSWQPEDLSHPAAEVGLFSQVDISQDKGWELPELGSSATKENTGIPEMGHLLGVSMTPMNMLERAKSLEVEAGQVLEEALKEAEKIKASAYQEVSQKVTSQTENQVKVIQQIVIEVQAWKKKVANQGEHMILGVAMEIAKTLFGDGFELDQQTIMHVMSQAIHKADSFGDLRIYVNPDDGEVLQYAWVEELSGLLGQNIKIIFDRSITRGGVIVRGEFGSIDATIDKKLERIEASLLSSAKERGNNT